MRKERYMDDTKLKKLGAELEKARTRQAEWTAKVRELERKYKEAENTCIHDMVHAADLTPEELAVIIRKARAGDFDRTDGRTEIKTNDKEVPIDE